MRDQQEGNCRFRAYAATSTLVKKEKKKNSLLLNVMTNVITKYENKITL